MVTSPCRRCGSQPTLEAVRIAYQDCYRLVCACGFNGAARMSTASAYDAWEQLQEPARIMIQRPTIKCLGTDHALCQRCLRRTAQEVDGAGWITARINSSGRGGCRNFVEGNLKKEG